VVDKRKVRRDHADFFSTVAEGVKGKRAVEWRFVDAVYPTSRFKEEVARRARELAEQSDRPASGPGIMLTPLDPKLTDDSAIYQFVTLSIGRAKRTAEITVKAPHEPQPDTPEGILKAGDSFWALRAFRELDDVLLRLRLNEPEIGTIVIRTSGDPEAVLAVDRTLDAHRGHWAVREIIHFIKRTLKRMDLTSRSFFAHIEPGSAFAGTLFELALAADRAYMLDDPDRPNTIVLRGCRPAFLPTPTKRRSCSRRASRSSRRTRSTPASSSPRPTISTGTTKCDSRSKSAWRCRPTRSPAWRRTCGSPDLKRWRQKSSVASRRGRTGFSSGPMPSASAAR
jgi:benzoyl-CoA-dihydrodiol lyase